MRHNATRNDATPDSKSIIRSYVGRIVRRLAKPFTGIVGPLDSWIRHFELRSAEHSVSNALEALKQRVDQSAIARENSAPVFVLASSWRSGSTLLQRLIIAGGDILVWGEPYFRSAYVQRLTDAIRPLSLHHPPSHFFPERLDAQTLSESWIANMYPPLENLLSAHRAFFDELYGRQARAVGYARWGFKSVRLNGAEARFLNGIFPNADFIVLVRNPFEAFRSYRRWLEWYDRWPDEPVFTVTRFGKMWRNRTNSLLAAAKDIQALVIRFEDLIDTTDSTTLDRLANHLDTKIQKEVLDQTVTAKAPPRPKLERLPIAERWLLNKEVADLGSKLGYQSSRDN